MQATQAHTQAIAKLRLQVEHLTTSLSEMEEDEFLGQTIANPEGQFEIGASSHNEQAEAITTLRSCQIMDTHEGALEVVDVQVDEDVIQNNTENIFKSLEPPTSTLFRDELIPAYVPRKPISQRLIGSTRKEDSLLETRELFKKVEINIPLLDAIKQIPSYTKFLKDLCTNNRQIQVYKNEFLTENVSSFSLVNMDKILFPMDLIVLNTQPVANVWN